MTNKFASLKEELRRAIVLLDRNQKFNIVLFHDGKATSLSEDGLLPATLENQRKGTVFLEEVTVGSTSDPTAALKAAFKQEPEMLFLLAGSDFPDNDAVAKTIRDLNPVLKTRVCTIGIFDLKKEKDIEVLKALEGIAKDNAGTYRCVDESKYADEPRPD